MSTSYIKFFPIDKNYIPSQIAQEKAVELLQELLPECGICEVATYNNLQFIDQGENLELIYCPLCKVEVQFADLSEDFMENWLEIEQTAKENGYEAIEVLMPCCNNKALFTDLTFYWPAGFAKFELSVEDPQVAEKLPPDQVGELEKILGCKLYQIWTLY